MPLPPIFAALISYRPHDAAGAGRQQRRRKNRGGLPAVQKYGRSFSSAPACIYEYEYSEPLPETEFICGMGEVLKTGLICDSELFRSVCRQKKQIRGLDSQVLASVDPQML